MVFNKVCNELIPVLPEIKKTRRSKLVDFYMLFLVMADTEKTLPLAQDERDQLKERLLGFGNDITAYQKHGDEEKESPSENIILYASGIRNSSDPNSRKNRFVALKAELAIIER